MALMIDTSHVGQGFLPLSFFQAAVAAGVTDFNVKAGGADDGLYKDAAHDQSVTFARQVGGKVHHYFFNGPAASPPECADAFYQYANPQPGDAMWWDIEPETGMAAWSAAQIAAADAQLATEGRTLPGDYLNESEVLSGQWNTRTGDTLWEAAYINGTPSTGAWGAYQWWQYTDSLNIAGVAVDASRPGTGAATNVVGAATNGEDMSSIISISDWNQAYLVVPGRYIIYITGEGLHLPAAQALTTQTATLTSAQAQALLDESAMGNYTADDLKDLPATASKILVCTALNTPAASLSSDQVASITAALTAALPAGLTAAEVESAVKAAISGATLNPAN